MSKYKNKDGIELSYTGNDLQSKLVKEVVGEAIKILGMYDRSCKISMGMAMNNTKKFLRANFDIGTKSERSDAWRIEQYNRNRPHEEHVKDAKDIPTLDEKIIQARKVVNELKDYMKITGGEFTKWFNNLSEQAKTVYRDELQRKK